MGDPLEREPEAVMRDVEDDYVSLERAKKDYGVVLDVVDLDLAKYEVNRGGDQGGARRDRGLSAKAWLEEDPETVARRYRKGELDEFDLVRRYGVIVNWGSGELLPETTAGVSNDDAKALGRPLAALTRRLSPSWAVYRRRALTRLSLPQRERATGFPAPSTGPQGERPGSATIISPSTTP